jgi:hypothetical protein
MTLSSFKQSSVKNSVRYEDMMVGYPATPVIGTASDAGTGGAASVTFTAAARATSYTVLSSPGSITATGISSPISISGLTDLTAYTFQVKASNSVGDSLYSAASNSVTPTSPSFESIATAVGTGASGVISFTSIPSTYKYLQIRGRIRSTYTTNANVQPISLQFNSDTAASYAFHYINGDGSATAAGGNTAGQAYIYSCLPTSNTSNVNPGAVIIDIAEYASTSKTKTIRAIGGTQKNNTTALQQSIGFQSGFWNSTAAVNRIDINAGIGNFTTDTTFALYGIKG